MDKPFTRIPHYFIERGRHLTPQAKWVWVILRTFENFKTKLIFPSHLKIEEESGLSRAAVNKALKELEEFKWIVKEKKSGKSTRYKLNFDAHYPDKELEDALTPIPTKEVAQKYKKERKDKRSIADGTFQEKFDPKTSKNKPAKKS